MAKTKTERIASIEEQIAQLEKRKKEIVQKQKEVDRKESTNRLCKRHGLLEKYMPDLITISDEQFELFIKTGIDTKYGRNRLAEIINTPPQTVPPQPKETPPAASVGNANENKPSGTGQVG